jgi:hypothetical protein
MLSDGYMPFDDEVKRDDGCISMVLGHQGIHVVRFEGSDLTPVKSLSKCIFQFLTPFIAPPAAAKEKEDQGTPLKRCQWWLPLDPAQQTLHL